MRSGPPAWGAATLGATLALAFGVAAGGDSPTPWPRGAPPTSTEIDAQVDDALALFELERYEEFLEAFEKGEDSEDIRLMQEDIDAGVWDKDALFVRGDALFEHEFRAADGYGARPGARFKRVHDGAAGGLDTFSCAGCHSLGGPDGAGSATQNAFFVGDGDTTGSAQTRNPPHVLGLGFVQALAAEMSTDLQLQRQDALALAVQRGAEVRAELSTREVDFGTLLARPDGTTDDREIDGVDADLVIKPFGWKGKFATLRRTIEDAARVHFGIQSHRLALLWMTDPDPALGMGPNWWDPDADGRQRELEDGIVTAASVYLAMLEGPVVIPPHDPALRDRWARGSALLQEIGCADCHRTEMLLKSPFWDEYPDTTDGDPVRVSLLLDGDKPKPSPRVQLYSDLKRHEMGAELADPQADDGTTVGASVFLTRPLWGLAETAPYLHDGRALTIPEAITMHGGEATEAADAFVALPSEAQADLHIFLLSLTREPKVRVPR